MAERKVATTVYLKPSQDQALKILSEKTKIPVAVFIREGIDLVLEKYRDKLPGQLSLLSEKKTTEEKIKE